MDLQGFVTQKKKRQKERKKKEKSSKNRTQLTTNKPLGVVGVHSQTLTPNHAPILAPPLPL
jgi:hypothetical protein